LNPDFDMNKDGEVDGDVDINGVPLLVSGGLVPLDLNENDIPDFLEEGEVTLSINDISKPNEIGLYPNPASDIVTVNSPNYAVL